MDTGPRLHRLPPPMPLFYKSCEGISGTRRNIVWRSPANVENGIHCIFNCSSAPTDLWCISSATALLKLHPLDSCPLNQLWAVGTLNIMWYEAYVIIQPFYAAFVLFSHRIRMCFFNQSRFRDIYTCHLFPSKPVCLPLELETQTEYAAIPQ